MPRFIIKHFISKQEAQHAIQTNDPSSIGQKMLNYIQQKFQYTPHKKKMIRISTKSTGHPWHFDGCHPEFVGQSGKFTKIENTDLDRVFTSKLVDNHMAWCHYGASLLLSDPKTYEGGMFQYMNKDGSIVSIKDDHYLSLVIHTAHKSNNPELHCVTPSHPLAQRKTLLVFV